MAAKITTDGMWRVSYGELPGLTPEEVCFPDFFTISYAIIVHPKTTMEI